MGVLKPSRMDCGQKFCRAKIQHCMHSCHLCSALPMFSTTGHVSLKAAGRRHQLKQKLQSASLAGIQAVFSVREGDRGVQCMRMPWWVWRVSAMTSDAATPSGPPISSARRRVKRMHKVAITVFNTMVAMPCRCHAKLRVLGCYQKHV